MATMGGWIEAGGGRLAAHLARPPGLGRVPGLVLCHGFPHGPAGAASSARSYPDLAERLAREAGWAVLAFNFRGTGESEGDFSMQGWLEDVAATVEWMRARPDVTGVWLAGSSTGGALALCHAASDDRVRGVATLSAPASFRGWVSNLPRFLDYCRHVGTIRSPGFPPDPAAWARQISELDPLGAAAKIPPRSLLLLHGEDDDVVPASESAALADAAGPTAELRVIPSAGHRLRHDPRAIALLIGWLARQEP